MKFGSKRIILISAFCALITYGLYSFKPPLYLFFLVQPIYSFFVSVLYGVIIGYVQRMFHTCIGFGSSLYVFLLETAKLIGYILPFIIEGYQAKIFLIPLCLVSLAILLTIGHSVRKRHMAAKVSGTFYSGGETLIRTNHWFQRLKRNRLFVWLLIMITTILWGYAWVVMKMALDYMGPFMFSSLRFIVGSLTMLFIVWIFRLGFPPREHVVDLIIIGVLQTSIVFLIVMYGLRFVDAGKSSVLLYSMPIWSSLFAARFLREKMRRSQIFGLSLGFLGLVAILGWDVWTNQSMKVIIGEILLILGAISWAVSNIYYRKKLRHISLLQVNAWQMVFGTIGIVIATFFTEWGEPIVWNGKSIFYVLFTGVIASALCFTLWFLLLRLINIVTATISTLLVSVFGLIFSFMILDEHLSLGIIVGSGFIILGIIIAQIDKKISPTS